MSKTYTVTLTDAEVKAMEYIAYDVQDWVDNALNTRARIAKQQIYDEEVARMTADESVESIPANVDLVVLAADIKSAKQKTDEQAELDNQENSL